MNESGIGVRWVLGLDIGANSVGWAALRLNDAGDPVGMLSGPTPNPERPSMGVRIFDAGVENYGQGESREATRSQARRLARQQRRQAERRARRRRKFFHLLQDAGLLPPYAAGQKVAAGGTDAARDQVIKALDLELLESAIRREPATLHSTLAERLPYYLRAVALDRPLSSFEVGRALYHLAQRRGFLSARRAPAKEGDDERSAVKAAISKLQQTMDEVDPTTGRPRARTLGEYLWSVDPTVERIRRRWTARQMFKAEFEAIFRVQAPHHGARFDEALRKRLFRALFHQRPLRSQAGLIGICELEDGAEWMRVETGEVYRARRCRRAPRCLMTSQRFRIWQDLNNLSWTDEKYESHRPTIEQRSALFQRLDACEALGKSDLKKALGLKGKPRFSFEAGGKRDIKGNLTNAQMSKLFGERWNALDAEAQESIVLELWSLDERTVERRAAESKGPWAWLAPATEEARRLEKVHLVDDYASVSRRAMTRLLPHLAAGEHYSRCVELEYGKRPTREPSDTLPPLAEVSPTLRNPVVSRALAETRRVVNGLIKLYGKPECVRVELARDMKRNKKEREQLLRAADDRRDVRERAFHRAREARGGGRLAQDDILRVQLWDECNGICPYTGRPISFHQLFGGEVDIEHIIPYSRSLDDSYLNKTLCFADFNRNTKRNRTPFEALSGNEPEWERALQRLQKHVADGTMSPAKLRRFQLSASELDGYLSDFTARHLNDTRYASRAARGYLASLYGGDERGVDADGRLRVQVSPGQITAILRRSLGMNHILGAGEKTREDHRHHAVDAVTVALTSPAIVKQLTDEAKAAERRTGRAKGPTPPPWEEFDRHVAASTAAIVVSHANYNRIRGKLFMETNYGVPRDAAGSRIDGTSSAKAYVHKRVALEDLSRKDVESEDTIVDARVRAEILRKLGNGDPKKVFNQEDPETLPRMPNGPVIRKVRVRVAKQAKLIAQGHRRRYVESAENHRMELFETVDTHGRARWRCEIIPLSQARRRAPSREMSGGAIQARYQFAIAKGDVIELTLEPERRDRFVVRGVSEDGGGRVSLTRPNDARDSRTRELIRLRVGKLQSQSCAKLVVTPIGLVRHCRA